MNLSGAAQIQTTGPRTIPARQSGSAAIAALVADRLRRLRRGGPGGRTSDCLRLGIVVLATSVAASTARASLGPTPSIIQLKATAVGRGPAGAQSSGRGALVDASSSRVGTWSYRCVALPHATVVHQCSLVYSFARLGTLRAEGLVRTRAPGRSWLAITGGTIEGRRAWGEIRVVGAQTGRARLTFYVLRKAREEQP